MTVAGSMKRCPRQINSDILLIFSKE